MTPVTIGRVIRGDARVYHIELLETGVTRQFAPRGKLFDRLDEGLKNPVAVGDLVEVSTEGDPPAVERVLERRNYLPRVASSRDPRQQVLFANVDQLIVIASIVEPRFSSNRTDRILAACEYYEIPAFLVLNKMDLDREDLAPDIRRTYEDAGIQVVETTATTGDVARVTDLLRGKLSVLYGASGAGKSTILNAIQPGLELRTGKISRHWSTGKHTTTYSQMYALDAIEARVIDTPGIRVFRLAGVNKAELRDCFPEFAPWQQNCRFPDCSHDHEPDCAVFAAVESGHLAPTRYASYVEIMDELVPPPEDDTPELPPDRDP